jgi:U6 snRNA-associated Sm-like protein LSm7
MSERGNIRGGHGRGGRGRGGESESSHRGGGGRGGSGRGGGGHQQAERPRKENILDLTRYMDKEIGVKFNGGREGEFAKEFPWKFFVCLMLFGAV